MILKFRALVWACVCLSLQTLRVFMALCKRWSDITTASVYVTYLWSSLFFQKSWALVPRGAREVWGDAFEGKTGAGGSQLIFDVENPVTTGQSHDKGGFLRLFSLQTWLFATIVRPWDMGFHALFLGKSWSFIICWGQVPCFFFPFDTKIYILFHLVEAASSRRSVESPLSWHFSD